MNAQVTAKKLHADNRGAVMLTGLCMSCFLIGSLWFLIGIGDAIVFRDTMQEAADHAAFTSAAFHARGMNFISACNLILLAMITIHIILGLIHDILLAFCILFAVPTLGSSCIPYPKAMKVYHTYAKIMKPVAAVIHGVELVAAYGFPILGSVKGFGVGNDYEAFGPRKRNLKVWTISPSMVPGGFIDGPLNAAFKKMSPKLASRTDNKEGVRKGLPVEGKPYKEICKKVASLVLDKVAELTGLGNILGKSGIWGWVKAAIGAGVQFRYCNDLGSAGVPDIGAQQDKANDEIDKANKEIDAKNGKLKEGEKKTDSVDKITKGTNGGANTSCLKGSPMFDPGLDKWWGCEGPLLPWGGTINGSPWNQIWAINTSPEYRDAQEHAVSLARRVGDGKYGQTSTAPSNTYFATAEFYFDCKEKWDDDVCNGDDNAGYSVEWRARLKRLDFPNIGQLLGSFAGQFLNRLDIIKQGLDLVKEKLGGKNPIQISQVGEAVDKAFKDWVSKPVQDALQNGGIGVDQLINMQGSFH